MKVTSPTLSKKSFLTTPAFLALTTFRPCCFLSITGDTVLLATLVSNVDKSLLARGGNEEDLTNFCKFGTDWKSLVSFDELLGGYLPSILLEDIVHTTIHTYDALRLLS